MRVPRSWRSTGVKGALVIGWGIAVLSGAVGICQFLLGQLGGEVTGIKRPDKVVRPESTTVTTGTDDSDGPGHPRVTPASGKITCT